MNFDLNENKEVVVLLGAGDMGLAIIKRISAGKKILLADINEENSGVIAHIFEVIAKIAKDQNMSDGFRVVNNCGDSAGQTVKHIHFHLMSGRNFTWPAG